jgi:hypothetical protein
MDTLRIRANDIGLMETMHFHGGKTAALFGIAAVAAGAYTAAAFAGSGGTQPDDFDTTAGGEFQGSFLMRLLLQR